MRLAVLALTTTFALGCNKSPEGGSVGTASTFSIVAPTLPTVVKQDNKESVALKLDRAKDFREDVKLEVSAPEKVKVELNRKEVKATDGSPDFTVTVTPAKDAPTADHKVRVTATPDKGKPTSVEFVVKVAENR